MSSDLDQWPPHLAPEAQPDLLQQPDIRVRWGQLPNQTMPLDWAEMFLQIVYNEHAGVFRAILPRLYRLPEEEPRRTRRRPLCTSG